MRQRVDHEGKAIDLLLALDGVENPGFQLQVGKYLQVVVMRYLVGGLAQRGQDHGLDHVQAHGLLEQLNAAIDHHPDPAFLQGLQALGGNR